MRNFSWNCFAVTGSIDAYLLFKDAEAHSRSDAESAERGEEDPDG
ncbi:hypothetical protein GCM10011571_15240 [Marinithermofilum abyssi]|uniref:YqzL-like protein n=1 Tax=Marinithermofilum abyssi TaxID=1571185 RepID=A0A8J2VG81_9BACL|nr:YqzL family protein [Marinithermofilum abyssi]GGE14710.1 hypothetical protein GCM10011571_15240 [Marinithermofilum abyssi]